MPINNATADSKVVEERLKGPKPLIVPDYSPNEIAWLQGLQKKLERSRNQRDTTHDELDGMTFVESWQAEEKAANTYIQPKINPDDPNFQSGIQRDSLIDIVANVVVNMDLSPNIRAYDSNQIELSSLGLAIEAIDHKCTRLENDDEKQVQRAMELLKHGYYFVEELWEERWHWAKKWINEFDGHIANAKWTKKMRKLWARPCRNLLSGLLVYLGDVTVYDSDYQPYMFTVKYRSYEDAESEYGREDKDGKNIWDRWKYVTKQRQDYATELGPQIIYNTWRLTEVTNNQVEEIHYQDPWGNEFAIMLNGVLMTPIGMPLPWGYDGYNIVQQNLEPIHPYWAYGGSLIKRMKANAAIYDELKKMGVLKTQKSFAPPYINISGKVVSRRVFMPGKISMGLKVGDLQPLHQKEVEGVTASELQMIQSIQQEITKKTQPPISAGGKGSNNAMIMAQQQQAKVAVGWFLFFITLGEQKLAWKRIFNLLAHWFDPTDTKIDAVKEKLVKQYRITSEEATLSGRGRGTRMVIPTDQEVSQDDVQATQDQLEKEKGQPYEVIAIKADEIKTAELTWEVTCIPKEKKTSDSQKVLIRGMLQDLAAFQQAGLKVKWDYVGEKWSNAWDEDSSKIFDNNPQGQQQMPGQQPGQQGLKPTTEGGAIPGLPTPQKGLSQAISNQIKV